MCLVMRHVTPCHVSDVRHLLYVRTYVLPSTDYRHVPQSKHKTYSAGPRSRHDDSDEEDFHQPAMLQAHINPGPSRRSCKQCRSHQSQLVELQKEHEQVLSDLNYYRWELAKKSEKLQEVGHVTSALQTLTFSQSVHMRTVTCNACVRLWCAYSVLARICFPLCFCPAET